MIERISSCASTSTSVLGNCKVLESDASLQRDPAEALDFKGLDEWRGESERAVAGADEVEAAALDQGERHGHRAGALAPDEGEVGEVGARADGAVHRDVPHCGADDLQHAEPLQLAPRRGARHREPHSLSSSRFATAPMQSRCPDPAPEDTAESILSSSTRSGRSARRASAAGARRRRGSR